MGKSFISNNKKGPEGRKLDKFWLCLIWQMNYLLLVSTRVESCYFSWNHLTIPMQDTPFFVEKIICPTQNPTLSRFSSQNWPNLGNSRFMFTSKSQIEQVAENIMYDGTHLLRQHNQLKWHCYFPLSPGIFLNTPSYLSLRWTIAKRKI